MMAALINSGAACSKTARNGTLRPGRGITGALVEEHFVRPPAEDGAQRVADVLAEAHVLEFLALVEDREDGRRRALRRGGIYQALRCGA